MKRYKKLKTYIPVLENDLRAVDADDWVPPEYRPPIKFGRYEIDNGMVEDGDGEWVKHDDVKHLRPNFSECGYTEEMLGDAQFQISRIMEAYEKEIRELKDRIGNDPKTHLQPGIKMPECNCKEMTKHKPASISRGNLFGDSLLPQSPDYWICPAHGYKKR